MSDFNRLRLLTIIAGLLLPVMSQAVETPARVAYVEGQVFVRRMQGGSVEPAEMGTALYQGDTIITKTGRAQIEIATSGVLRVSANSRIHLPMYSEREHPQAFDNELKNDEVFEVRTPTLVAGVQDRVKPYGVMSDYIIGVPATDDEIAQAVRRRGTTSAWPVLSIPPASVAELLPGTAHPVIPDPCTIVIVEHPEDSVGKFEGKYQVLNREVTGTGRWLDLPRVEHQKAMRQQHTFLGKIEDNRITGTWKLVFHYEYETSEYEHMVDMSGEARVEYLLNVAGTMTGSSVLSLRTRWSWPRKPADQPWEPGGNSQTFDETKTKGQWRLSAPR